MISNFCVSRTRSLEVTNTPGTAKVLVSNLTALFFLQTEIELSAYYLSAYVFSAQLPNR